MFVRALEFYSGIGGLHKAFSQSQVDGSVVHAFDWDQSACRVYNANYGDGIVQKADISTLTAAEFGSWKADLWLLSPSCQPYTVLNPLAKGAADPRAKSFIHLMEEVLVELVLEGTHPQYMLVENVAGFETSSTRQRLLSTLDSLGYTTVELLLTPLQFGIPNSRLRYYLLAKMKPLSFAHSEDYPPRSVWRHIPGDARRWADPRLQGEFQIPVTVAIDPVRNYLDDDADEVGTYSVPDRVLEKWGRLFDIILPSSTRSCCFTRGYTKMVERTGSILQMNEDLDTTLVFDHFLEAQRAGQPDSVQILHPLRMRYFSPSELLRIFGFLSTSTDISAVSGNFIWPDGISTKTQYKLIGNSVNVCVVTALINYLFTE